MSGKNKKNLKSLNQYLNECILSLLYSKNFDSSQNGEQTVNSDSQPSYGQRSLMKLLHLFRSGISYSCIVPLFVGPQSL